MKQVDRGQITRIHVLLGKVCAGMSKEELKEYKAGLVGQYTNYRETSTTQLSYAEAEQMIDDLQRVAGRAPEEIKANIKRRRILHIAHELGWELPDGSVDLVRVNGFCVNRGQYHKPLNDHTLAELSHLIYQFQQVYKSHLKSV